MPQESIIGIYPGVIELKEPLTSLLIEWPVTLLNDLMHRLDMNLLQYVTCLLTCLGAVADLILRLQLKFGHRLA